MLELHRIKVDKCRTGFLISWTECHLAHQMRIVLGRQTYLLYLGTAAVAVRYPTERIACHSRSSTDPVHVDTSLHFLREQGSTLKWKWKWKSKWKWNFSSLAKSVRFVPLLVIRLTLNLTSPKKTVFSTYCSVNCTTLWWYWRLTALFK